MSVKDAAPNGGKSLLPTSVLRGLGDNSYERRKAAALELESLVRRLIDSEDIDRLDIVVNTLLNDYALSLQANQRKGGLIGLAALTVGLGSMIGKYLQSFVDVVVSSLGDKDARIRYYACESLYNIAKVCRESITNYFERIFDSLCRLSADTDSSVQNASNLLNRLVKDIVTESDSFDIQVFIPLLRSKLEVHNPYVREFLVGWISTLDSVPDIDMLIYLPDFLQGLFSMLSDSKREIKQAADSVLSEFLTEIRKVALQVDDNFAESEPVVDWGRMIPVLVEEASSQDEFTSLTALVWMDEFVVLAKERLLPHFPGILTSILLNLAALEERISNTAKGVNQKLLSLQFEGLDVEATFESLKRTFQHEEEITRLESLQWMRQLLERREEAVLKIVGASGAGVCGIQVALGDSSEKVAISTVEWLGEVSNRGGTLTPLVEELLKCLQQQPEYLNKRGPLVVRRLCMEVGSLQVFLHLAMSLEEITKTSPRFVKDMTQSLNFILMTAEESKQLRQMLNNAHRMPNPDKSGSDLFSTLYRPWCYSPTAAISLCLLARAYDHSSRMIELIGEMDISVDMLVQIDQLVRLLESPVFAYLRLQLLYPRKYPSLLRTLYGLLMLLPQTPAFRTLSTRLNAVPTMAFLHSGEGSLSQDSRQKDAQLEKLLAQFKEIQLSLRNGNN